MKILSHRIFENKVEHDLTNIKTVSKYAQGIEIDIHLTKDNKLILNHDSTTYSKTNIVDEFIYNLTWEELKNKYPNKYYLLNELLDTYVNEFDLINIEIKTYNIEYKNIEKILLNTLEKYDNVNKFIISSFNINTIKKLNDLNCKYKIGYLFEQMWVYNMFKATIKYDYLNIDYKTYIDNNHYFSKYDNNIILWTVNDENVYKYLLNKTNIKYVISDDYKIGLNKD